MKRVVYVILCVVFLSLVGCSSISNTKVVGNFKTNDIKVYSLKESKKVKALLKSYGNKKSLTVKEAKNKNIVVINNEKIVENEKLWTNFYKNSKNKMDDSILIVQYTEQNDPLLTYLSYKDNKFFMIEDDSRDQYRDTKDKDYYEYSFRYLKLFKENNKTYVYLLDDDKITLDKLNYSLLSSKISDWIPYGFVFYYAK
ncbi:DUF4362 domain-containing protein [Terrisporobacter sp.]